jgi:hypothetical protein
VRVTWLCTLGSLLLYCTVALYCTPEALVCEIQIPSTDESKGGLIERDEGAAPRPYMSTERAPAVLTFQIETWRCEACLLERLLPQFDRDVPGESQL